MDSPNEKLDVLGELWDSPNEKPDVSDGTDVLLDECPDGDSPNWDPASIGPPDLSKFPDVDLDGVADFPIEKRLDVSDRTDLVSNENSSGKLGGLDETSLVSVGCPSVKLAILDGVLNTSSSDLDGCSDGKLEGTNLILPCFSIHAFPVGITFFCPVLKQWFSF